MKALIMRKIKRILLFGGILCLITTISWMLLRNHLLNYIIQQKIQAVTLRYPLKVEIKKAYFSGWRTVSLLDVKILETTKDTLILAKKIEIRLRILPLLNGNLVLAGLSLHHADIHLRKKNDQWNIGFLAPSDKTFKHSANSAAPSTIPEKIVQRLVDYLPGTIDIISTKAIVSYENYPVQLTIPSFALKNGKFSGTMEVAEQDTLMEWKGNGQIDLNKETFSCTVFPIKRKGYHHLMPILQKAIGLRAAADTLVLAMHYQKFTEDSFLIKGRCAAKHLELYNKHLSVNDIQFPDISFDYSLRFGTNSVEVDSNSTLQLKRLKIHPYLSVTFPTTIIRFNTRIDTENAQDFFDALPKGLFTQAQGLKAKGKLKFRSDLFIDLAQIDSLRFSSSLEAKNFSLNEKEAKLITRINGPFEYVAYEKGLPVATRAISPESPSYSSLDNISPYLKNCVLTSEDGNFYWHHGFNPEMFRRAIAINLHSGKFMRGGSTISMQLVKNVFLSRNKNVARKLEEALIVWLIENNRLVSKERMYEVYLNIIEWGPGVYGAREAAEFYFKKAPSELSIEESLFLAMIVPMPKWFRYQFGDDGKLKPNAQGYFMLVAGHLFQKGIITEEEKNTINCKNVTLSGKAKEYLMQPAVNAPDSLVEE